MKKYISLLMISVFVYSCAKKNDSKGGVPVTQLVGSQQFSCADESKSFTLESSEGSFSFKMGKGDKKVELSDLKCSNTCKDNVCRVECTKLNEQGFTIDLNESEKDDQDSSLGLIFYSNGVGYENDEASVIIGHGGPYNFIVKNDCDFEKIKINDSPEMHVAGDPTIDLMLHKDYSSRIYYKVFPNKNNLYTLLASRSGHIGLDRVYRSFDLECETEKKSVLT